MMNYIKSEWYRMTHSKEIYMFTGILAGTALLFNTLLFVMAQIEEGFRYATVSFSLSMFVCSLSVLFYSSLALVGMFCGQEKKNSLLKNVVAYGISREEIFIGKCIVFTLISICSMFIILFVYIGSAVLLLEQGPIENVVVISLRGVTSMLLAAVAYEVLVIVLYIIFEKEIVSCIMWYVIMALVPELCILLGMKYEFFGKLASWMPCGLLRKEVTITLSTWKCVWETSQGFVRCLITGGVWLILFLVWGLLVCKKQEV